MKEYKFSITKNYVSDWGLIEGIREILQNAIDSSGEMHLELNKDELIIENDGIKLPIKTLLMGYGTKANDSSSIGGKSEGSLLALMVLIRDGYEVLVKNSDEYWNPRFKYDEDLDEQILVIQTAPLNPPINKLSYCISGLSEKDIGILKYEFPILNEVLTGKKYDSINTQCGEIILDKEYRGRMFVEGLPIQRDGDFEFGYNFKTNFVHLDRDRKAINYYELRALTAQSLVTAEECHPELFKAISNSCTDARDIIDVLDDATNNFLESYRDMFYEDNNLEDNTLVATKAVKKQLEQLDTHVKVVEGTEIESYLMAKANDKLDLVYKAQNIINTQTKLEKDLSAFVNSRYIRFMEVYMMIKKYLPKKYQKIIEALINDLADEGTRRVFKFIPEGFDYSYDSARALKNKILNNDEDEEYE